MIELWLSVADAVARKIISEDSFGGRLDENIATGGRVKKFNGFGG